ncbi:CsbD family protein [Polaribacter sp. WD7]|uniref:CsbD family protein n=1 Tax=Polaribacter sp. WD7 TaxID=2269061 RepID=UPI000DF46659|nr:CsbD family protein [Polaribacter sp. WD7]RCS26922.1 CsbD family protein [Polaribacter sp. WD7]
MNTDTKEGIWKQIKGEFKERYGDATNDDSIEQRGKVDQFIGEMQEKYGKTKDEIANKIKNW